MFKHFSVRTMFGTKERIEVVCVLCGNGHPVITSGYGKERRLDVQQIAAACFVHMCDTHPAHEDSVVAPTP